MSSLILTLALPHPSTIRQHNLKLSSQVAVLGTYLISLSRTEYPCFSSRDDFLHCLELYTHVSALGAMFTPPSRTAYTCYSPRDGLLHRLELCTHVAALGIVLLHQLELYIYVTVLETVYSIA